MKPGSDQPGSSSTSEVISRRTLSAPGWPHQYRSGRGHPAISDSKKPFPSLGHGLSQCDDSITTWEPKVGAALRAATAYG
jgi:hypothetical protein